LVFFGDCFLSKSLGWSWVGVPVFFGSFVLAVVHVSRVLLLHCCRAWWWRSWSSLRDLSITCGSMLSPVVFFAGGMGGWVSSPPWCPGCQHLMLPLLLRYTPFVVFQCCWMRRSWGVGMLVSSFPLLVVVVALGRLSCRSFPSSPPKVACCLSID
jgi:hypothetical protein